jgi:integrase/recombinase XerD
MLYSSGLRISELLDLKPVDIDPDRKVIYVRGGKGNKDRITVLSLVAYSLLVHYLELYHPKTWLFEGPEGNPYSPRSLNKVIHKSAALAGIAKKVSAHTLRHSFATHLLEHGTDLRYIQALLGHESSKTTERYAHVTRKGFEQIVSPLDYLANRLTLEGNKEI